LQSSAKENNIYIVGGSIPEKGEDGVYHNTSLVFNRKGEIIARHRKLHLFDVNIPGKIVFKESDIFVKGTDVTTFDTEYGKMGLAVCYDVRFPELALLMARRGVKVIFYPSAFGLTTGSLHWELLLRSRALDNQVYTVGCMPARFVEDPTIYQAWGHSTVVDPMGRVVVTTEHEPAILYADIDLDLVEDTRNQLPYTISKRYDLYTIEETKLFNQLKRIGEKEEGETPKTLANE